MNNFEEANKIIKKLKEENKNLKNKLKAALWKLSSSSVEESKYTVNTQVGSSSRLIKWEKDKNEAMQRYTARLRKQAKIHRERRNGS